MTNNKTIEAPPLQQMESLRAAGAWADQQFNRNGGSRLPRAVVAVLYMIFFALLLLVLCAAFSYLVFAFWAFNLGTRVLGAYPDAGSACREMGVWATVMGAFFTASFIIQCCCPGSSKKDDETEQAGDKPPKAGWTTLLAQLINAFLFIWVIYGFSLFTNQTNIAKWEAQCNAPVDWFSQLNYVVYGLFISSMITVGFLVFMCLSVCVVLAVAINLDEDHGQGQQGQQRQSGGATGRRSGASRSPLDGDDEEEEEDLEAQQALLSESRQ